MMKKYTISSTTKLFVVSMLLLLCNVGAKAQSTPFECDYNAYLFQYNDIYALDLASGSSYLVAENITPGNVNAAAYNSSDGYIWGYLSTPSSSIVRIGKNFEVDQYEIPGLPSGNKYVGDISIDGIYYFKAGGASFYKIDLNPESNTYLDYLGVFSLSQSLNIHDWAFNAQDEKLYSVEKNTNILYRITPETGIVEALGVVPILQGLNYTFGAVYFDVDGNFYVSANQTGSVYKIERAQDISLGIIKSNIFAFGPAASSNDGARCPTAPVPQEDCINGLDDDGDGLVDCDDPSCSGVAACPTINLTSGANDGGLESNDRLSSLIGERNYNRAKTNYKFNKHTAKRLMKGASYAKAGKSTPDQIPLTQLVPLDVVGESSTIESSPADLLDLTNASDIYSVDYLKKDDNIGALMVIKTDNKVYEHSKFICDRFLGAQLLSVSNIQLREKDFIKSIIKQPDGSTEFALTFSARLNASNEFVVESHWNIDAYAEDTAFYNFQIWSNTVDDLLLLADEILNLLEVHSPIAEYKGSTPPPVFVKSAKYVKGEVILNLVNSNKTEQIQLEGGLKKTETSSTETMKLSAPIDGYLDSVALSTGNIFDFGFRVSHANGTPDDLFVADAPWGLDSSAEGTTVENYEVKSVQAPYTGDGYPVERNIELSGKTSSYVGVYRAMSPRFTAVDLSDYGKLSFEASGTGTLEVKLLDGNGVTFSQNVNLSAETKSFNLLAGNFKSSTNSTTDFSSLKVINFNLLAEGGTLEEKQMSLSNVSFNNIEEKRVFISDDTSESIVYPNPMQAESSLYFYEENSGTFTFELFNMAGKKIASHDMSGDSKAGQNMIVVKRNNLTPGLYFYKITSSNDKTWSSKLMVK
ncbi:T9SS type A sorting domain-containing protein [Zobellia alginiliquefaciens]|uniref:T9SS type A sorting domain-containing protein n=1 Tax=Zobellia alginiliquefaciens TaxID=3032586 RepID=UPI0023E36D50|nr:T9SS type A sorting domain-containing protein [Zobellia alginiliquefaciens]